MNRTSVALLTDRFASLKDPRTGHVKRHKFIDVIIIASCAAICGADSWVYVEVFGKSKKDWLSRLFELPNGFAMSDNRKDKSKVAESRETDGTSSQNLDNDPPESSSRT